MEFEQAQKVTSKVLLYSVIEWVNGLKTFSEDEKDKLLNMVFNILTNSFEPTMAIHFNEEIFKLSKSVQEEELKKLFDKIGWKE